MHYSTFHCEIAARSYSSSTYLLLLLHIVYLKYEVVGPFRIYRRYCCMNSISLRRANMESCHVPYRVITAKLTKCQHKEGIWKMKIGCVKIVWDWSLWAFVHIEIVQEHRRLFQSSDPHTIDRWEGRKGCKKSALYLPFKLLHSRGIMHPVAIFV